MFEDILGEEEKITWESGYYYAPYIPLLIVKWSKELKEDIDEKIMDMVIKEF